MKVQRGAVLSCYHWLNHHACCSDEHLVLISLGYILIFQDFKWKHHNIQFKYAAIQIKDYQTIDCMPLLTLIFNQFTAHRQEGRVRKYENISGSYCWPVWMWCLHKSDDSCPGSQVELGNLRNLQDSQNLRPLRSRLLSRCKRRDHKRVSEVTGLDSDLISEGGTNRIRTHCWPPQINRDLPQHQLSQELIWRKKDVFDKLSRKSRAEKHHPFQFPMVFKLWHSLALLVLIDESLTVS